MDDQFLTSESVQMLISSLTANGSAPLSELEVERLLNALTRLRSNVPTGIPTKRDQDSISGNNSNGR